MEFRPCIDIHNGKVKQIVGSSLKDEGNLAKENFVSEYGAADYAKMYRDLHIKGGHIILLNHKDSEYYEATKAQAMSALAAYPGGMQIGGGIDTASAPGFIQAGASHVIVTSYVFRDGQIDFERLCALRDAVGKEHLVLDLSCRKKDNDYYIVTDRWQKFTDVVISDSTLNLLVDYCDEFLIHAVDVEGKNQGVEQELVAILGKWGKCPITYAGGVHSMEDLDLLKQIGCGKLHVTIGSALKIFGGTMELEDVLARCQE